jgi:very-short-patch-repair endonuclease
VKERNDQLLGSARTLRKNMTKEERHLWFDFLREFPVRFRRQEIIGSYIADFYCAKARLVVELDGSQHYLQETMNDDTNGLNILKVSALMYFDFPTWISGATLKVSALLLYRK